MFGKLLALECLRSYYIRTEIYALKRRQINSVQKLVKRARVSKTVRPISSRVSFLLTCEPYEMIFLTVVACEIGRNSYFGGTDQRAGSGVCWELWVICCTNSDPLEIWISLGSAFFAYFLFRQLFPLASMGLWHLHTVWRTFPRSQRVLGFRIRQVPSVFSFNKF